MPTRCWELLAGGFAAFYLSNPSRREPNKTIGESAGLLGIVLIFYAVFAYNKLTPIPGIYTIVPIIGTLLVILFANENNILGKFLGNKALVYVGLISYSAYLWHQPLFAFARHTILNDISLLTNVILSLFSLILAYFSWRYIEEPFRKKNKIKAKIFHYYSISFCILIIIIGLIGNISKGFELRFNQDQRYLLSFNKYKFEDIYKKGECLLNPDQTYLEFKKICTPENTTDSILVWGDSHAAALAFGLRNQFKNLSQYTASGCPPLLGMEANISPNCQDINRFISKEVEHKKPKVIVLHSNWLLYGESNIPHSLFDTIDYIKVKSPKTKIYVVGSVPQYNPSLPTYILKNQHIIVEDLQLMAPVNNRISIIDNQIKLLSSQLGVYYFSPIDVFCVNKQCLVTFRFEENIMPMAWDYGHLTSAGSVFLSKKFKLFYINNS